MGDASRDFLDWWWRATRREALNDVTRMMFTDQRWVDFVPCFFDHVILKDPGFNVAYWNLHARKLAFAGGRYLVDGVPLRFFHFSGFDPQKPWLLSRHQGERPRVLLSEQPALQRICGEYLTRLQQAGFADYSDRPYGWSTLPSGLRMTRALRRLYWTGLAAAEQGQAPEPPDPFDEQHPDAFVEWLNAPREGGPRRLSRYLHSIHESRLDLQIHFRDVTARLTLTDGKVDPARLWASSLGVKPVRRAVDVTAGQIEVKVDRFYKAGAAPKWESARRPDC